MEENINVMEEVAETETTELAENNSGSMTAGILLVGAGVVAGLAAREIVRGAKKLGGKIVDKVKSIKDKKKGFNVVDGDFEVVEENFEEEVNG